jgi:hypothetical protein
MTFARAKTLARIRRGRISFLNRWDSSGGIACGNYLTPYLITIVAHRASPSRPSALALFAPIAVAESFLARCAVSKWANRPNGPLANCRPILVRVDCQCLTSELEHAASMSDSRLLPQNRGRGD